MTRTKTSSKENVAPVSSAGRTSGRAIQPSKYAQYQNAVNDATTQRKTTKITKAAKKAEKKKKKDATATALQVARLDNGQDARIAQLQQELEAMKETATKAKALAKKFKRKAAAASNVVTAAPTLPVAPVAIPKPKGKFNLPTAMGLKDNLALYHKIRNTTLDAIRKSGCDSKLTWATQPALERLKVIKAVIHKEAYIKEHQLDWAVDRIAHQFLRNVKAHTTRKNNPDSKYSKKRAARLEAAANAVVRRASPVVRQEAREEQPDEAEESSSDEEDTIRGDADGNSSDEDSSEDSSGDEDNEDSISVEGDDDEEDD